MFTRLAASVAAVLMTAASVGFSAPQPATGPADDTLDKLVAQLKTEADAFAAAKDDKGPTASALVGKVQYTDAQVQSLNKALQARHGQPVPEMYVYYQLLQPLKSAGNETLRRVKPALLNLLTRYQYQPMKVWAPAALAAIRAVPSDSKELMKQMEKITKLREEKLAGEQPIVKYNRTCSALAKTCKQLLLMMADAQADDTIINRLIAEEAALNADFLETLNLIKAEAIHMDQPRAKKYYDKLNAHARNCGTKKKYTIFTSPQYNDKDNSAFATTQDGPDNYAAVPILTVVNVLATNAKEQAVKIPDVKAFEESQKPKARG